MYYRNTIENLLNKGEVETLKKVVEEVDNPDLQISLEEAREYDPEFMVGDELYTDVTPTSFEKMGRTTASKIKTLFIQKVSERERENVELECKKMTNEIVSCQVQSVEVSRYYDEKAERFKEKRRVFVSLGKLEGVLNEGDLLPNDNYRAGQMLRAILLPLDKNDRNDDNDRRRKNRDTTLRLSRTNELFLRKLFEKEVPEIAEGIIEIKAIARKPGQRSKVAVYSNNPNIDPVSSCVGNAGTRVNAIGEELSNEKIDVIRWSPDLAEFVANSLSPAQVMRNVPVIIEDDLEKAQDGRRRDKIGKVARVTIANKDLTLAIGSKGINVALAATLCRCRIDINGVGDDSGAEEDRSELSSIMA
ncbi:MAG: transcription termination factor NusA [Clostridia bacterium]|nr:transcription termination factor NusA [Clostridia bacterium]